MAGECFCCILDKRSKDEERGKEGTRSKISTRFRTINQEITLTHPLLATKPGFLTKLEISCVHKTKPLLNVEPGSSWNRSWNHGTPFSPPFSYRPFLLTHNVLELVRAVGTIRIGPAIRARKLLSGVTSWSFETTFHGSAAADEI